MKLHITSLCLSLYPILSSAAIGSYSGPNEVGTVDIEVPVTNPIHITNTTFINGTYAFNLQTVYFSLYYPAAANSTSSKPEHPWLAPPGGALIAQGLSNADNGQVPSSLIEIGFDVFAANLTIPAAVDVPLVSGTGMLPVMVFSHGNPTMSQWYSQFYGELASRGVVVAAVTHRDGSSPATRVSFKNGSFYDFAAFSSAMVMCVLRNG